MLCIGSTIPGIPDRLDVFTQLDLLGPLSNSSNLGAGCKWHYSTSAAESRKAVQVFGIWLQLGMFSRTGTGTEGYRSDLKFAY